MNEGRNSRARKTTGPGKAEAIVPRDGRRRPASDRSCRFSLHLRVPSYTTRQAITVP